MARTGITFVYRSSYDGPLGKRVVALPDASVLTFFQRAFKACAGKDGSRWLKKELGGDVYGLDSLFDGGDDDGGDDEDDDDDGGDKPLTTTRQLKALLEEDLYVEGEIKLDDHSLRVLTDDDEVQLAYYFFDRTFPKDRIAWLLHDTVALPTRAAKQPSFKSPVKCSKLLPSGRGEGMTWACLLTFYDSDSISEAPPSVFDKVRLPDLAAHLRATTPQTDAWPFELRLLRAMVYPQDTSIGPALQRCAAYPVLPIGGTDTSALGSGAHATARAELLAPTAGLAKPPKGSQTSLSDHAALLSLHVDKQLGYQQWVLFDDLWATANPDLAASLLRYACRWDPLR